MFKNSRNTLVWSKRVRALHWMLALVIVLNLFFTEDYETIHEVIGYIGLGLVLLRIVMGIRSTGPAGFSQFLRPQYDGHNRIAWVVYFGIWFCVVGLAVTGFLMGLDYFFGETWLEDIHEGLATAVQVLVVLHFLGIIKDMFLRRRLTFLAMYDGKK